MSLITVKIYLDNLIHNYHILKSKTPHLAAVVKADGYGLGAITVTKTLIKQGVQKFFVASASEGKVLRKKFSDIDIYVFDGFIEQQTILDYHLKPVLNSVDQLQMFAHTAHNNGAILHIDTGMNRLGIPFQDIHTINTQNVMIDYIMTHFSDSEANHPVTIQQTEKLVASAKYLRHTPYKTDFLGRAGVALYGGIVGHDLRPVVSVSGNILQKKHIAAGEPVGYGSTFMTKKPTTLFTVAGGYADGIMRSLSNSDFCGTISGYKIPLVGRVSMDTTIFDATDLPDSIIQTASELEFFGLNNPITEIAVSANTIPYEFLTNLSRRANRIIIA
jgi:alanine racemase